MDSEQKKISLYSDNCNPTIYRYNKNKQCGKENKGQFFLQFNDGEYMLLGENLEGFEVGMQCNSQWIVTPMEKLFCNNWRKMHGLPLIRRRGLSNERKERI